jgi:hypothetical protein
MTSVNLRPITGAGTIGTFYGVRIQATTAQTITNRWGISQEDTLAKNQLLGNAGVGIDPGVGKVIASLTLTNAGTGATNGTYSQAALTGGSGTGATADIVVAGSVVTSLVLRGPGQGYVVGDTLSTAAVGGSGFVFTVASVASILRSDGTIVAPRIGAGTATPRATMESKGLIYASASGLNVAINPGFSAFPSLARANLLISSDGEPTGQMVLADVDTFAMSIYAIAQFDASALTAGKNVYGAYNRAILTNTSAAGNMFVFAATNQASITTAAMTGKSVAFMGGSSNTVSIGGVAGANTVTTIQPLSAQASIGASAAQTITSVELIAASASFTVSAHTVTNFYGLRLRTTTLSGGATITNRWGISQEDTLAKNYFAGNVGIGTASPTGRLHVVGGTAAAATNGAPVTIIAQSAGTGNQNGGNIVLTPGALSGTGSAGVADLSGPTGTGLKLPATPGNIDTQVLDCYAEGTWTPTLTGFGGTVPIATARYTRIGRLVSLQVTLSAVPATTFSSVATNTYISLPPGMTAAVEAPGSTSTSGIAADGSCVAFTNGNFYLPTFALRAANTYLNVTYTV